MRNAMRNLKLSALAAVLCVVSAKPAGAADNSVVDANTRPSMDAKVAFAAQGLVSEVNVNVGDTVKAGQVMARQDDRQDVAELQRLQIEANSTAEIDNYVADTKIKQIQYDRMNGLLKKGNLAAPSEVESAEQDLILAQTQVKMSTQKKDEQVLEAAKQAIKVELMKLVSPIDGVVEARNINPGEIFSADPQNHEGAIEVVRNDPLWVEMNLSTEAAMQLHAGDLLPVKYSWDKDWQSAKIIAFPPRSDAKSDTQMVRLELANPTGVRSGAHMQVKLPEKIAAVAASDANNP
jgi:RND family efflux transporter MFP subunit